MANIAFCGLGIMGSQMAARLRAAGHELAVWNRTREKSDAWVKSGGKACATPAEASRNADQLHLMLANDDAVDAVLFGPDGALTTLPKDALVVDHSTVSVLMTAVRAKRIKEGGWRYLHAPVLAGPANVVKGEGLMIAGGSKSVYEAAAPTLRQIIEKLWYVGDAERDAASLKLMANSVLLNITQALAEYYALGRACGLLPERALELFDHFDPGRTIYIRGPRMARGDYTATFQVSMAAKDADLMLRAAREGGANLPTLELVQQRLLRLIKSGHGDLDLGALGYDTIHGTTAGHEAVKVGGEG
jgi:3-hydroxyisobutyrate dehydrogenase